MSNNNAGNTNIQTSTLVTTAIFSRDNQHRYVLTKHWNDHLPKAAVLMIQAGHADTVRMDTTTMLCVSNACDNGFGEINMLNLFSSIQSDTPESDKVNDATIVKYCEQVDKIIVAFGKGKENLERKAEILKLLETFKEKLVCIADNQGRTMFHPLAPQVRGKWNLVPFEISKTD